MAQLISCLVNGCSSKASCVWIINSFSCLFLFLLSLTSVSRREPFHTKTFLKLMELQQKILKTINNTHTKKQQRFPKHKIVELEKHRKFYIRLPLQKYTTHYHKPLSLPPTLQAPGISLSMNLQDNMFRLWINPQSRFVSRQLVCLLPVEIFEIFVSFVSVACLWTSWA